MRFCWATYLLWAVIAVFGAGAMLSACGQKGPLFLPEKQAKKTDSGKTEEEKKKPAK